MQKIKTVTKDLKFFLEASLYWKVEYLQVGWFAIDLPGGWIIPFGV